MDSASQKLTGVIPKDNQQNIDPCSWKLTGEESDDSSECMLSEVDWGAHETHPNGHSITEVDWGGHDPSLYLTDGCMLLEVDWGGHGSSPSHITSECMLSEVDWGAGDSSFFLYLKYIDHYGDPNDLFTQGL